MKRRLLYLALAIGACNDFGGPASVDVAWSIRVNGVPSTCSAAGADTVTYDFRRVSTGELTTFVFSCSAGQGVSTPDLVQDDYDLTVTLWRDYNLSTRLALASRTFAVFLPSRTNILPDVLFDLALDSPAA